MVIEKFNLSNFFSLSKRGIINKNGQYSGIGAISIVTPHQGITKYNLFDRNYNGRLVLGLGDHKPALYHYAILILKDPDKIIGVVEENDILKLLNESIVIRYTNSSTCVIDIQLPKIMTDNQITFLEYLATEIEALDKSLCQVYVETSSYYLNDKIEEVNKLEKGIMFAKQLVDNDYEFPYDENIVIEPKNMVQLMDNKNGIRTGR